MDNENNQEFELVKNAIHERIASLDAPVRNLLLSDEYIVLLSEILNSHSLKKEECAITEEITTNFLLGTVRPRELEQIFGQGLPNLTKENVRSLYNDIKTKILSRVWDTIENAWAEDDENEQIFNELLEMDEIPLPPSAQKDGSKTLGDKVNKEIIKNKEIELEKEQAKTIEEIKPAAVITNEELVKKISEEKSTWDKKADAVDANNSSTVTSRNNVDTSLPKISLGSSDPYKESIE